MTVKPAAMKTATYNVEKLMTPTFRRPVMGSKLMLLQQFSTLCSFEILQFLVENVIVVRVFAMKIIQESFVSFHNVQGKTVLSKITIFETTIFVKGQTLLGF